MTTSFTRREQIVQIDVVADPFAGTVVRSQLLVDPTQKNGPERKSKRCVLVEPAKVPDLRFLRPDVLVDQEERQVERQKESWHDHESVLSRLLQVLIRLADEGDDEHRPAAKGYVARALTRIHGIEDHCPCDADRQ
jgi:hypothetical protein